jgi:WD40 repeat protein
MASHSTNNVTKIWRIDQPDRRDVLAGHRIYVSCVALAPDDTKIVSGDANGEIRIWDVAATRQERILLDHHERVLNLDFSPDGHLLASTSSDRHAMLDGRAGSIIVWETSNWKPTKRFETESAVPCMTLFSADGRYLISALDDGTVSYRRVGGDFEEFRRFDTGQPGVMSLAIAPYGMLLATGHPTGAIELWDVESSHHRGPLQGHSRPIMHVEFSPDGKLLASSAENGEIRLWETTTRQLCVAPMQEFTYVPCVRFFSDGKTLVSCSQQICLWDVQSGAKRGVLRGSTTGVNDLAVSRSGRLLVTGDGSFNVRLWRAASPAEVAAERVR